MADIMRQSLLGLEFHELPPEDSTSAKRRFNTASSLEKNWVGQQASHSWTTPTTSWRSSPSPKLNRKTVRSVGKTSAKISPNSSIRRHGSQSINQARDYFRQSSQILWIKF